MKTATARDLKDDAYIFSESTKNSNWITKVCAWLIPAMLIFSTLAFGGVHEGVFLSCQIVLFVVCALVLLRPDNRAIFRDNTPTTRGAFFLLTAFLLYAITQSAFLLFCTEIHPIVEKTSCLPDAIGTKNSLNFLASLIALFILFVFSFKNSQLFYNRFLKSIWVMCILVSFIALSHWFYDNGKLFWVFEPDYIFATRRARWPFVNSNHLGHFTLLIFFLLFSVNRVHIHSFVTQLYETPRFSEQPLLKIISRKKHLNALIIIAFEMLGLMALLLCMAATLSRSTWLGLLAGLVTFVLLSFIKKNSLPRLPEQPRQMMNPVKRRRRRESKKISFQLLPFITRNLALILPGIAVLVFLLFLYSGQGVELIEGRIEYGLASSKEDIRWTLYSDSVKMLDGSPIFGSGISSWHSLYPRYMSHSLADISPGFLHSDPLQLLIEYGVAGTLILFTLGCFILYRLIMSSTKGYPLMISLGIVSGLLALIIASTFDFPFRIPAISYLSIAMVALLCLLLDLDSKNSDT